MNDIEQPRRIMKKVISYGIFTASDHQCGWQAEPFTPEDHARMFEEGLKGVVLTGEYEEATA